MGADIVIVVKLMSMDCESLITAISEKTKREVRYMYKTADQIHLRDCNSGLIMEEKIKVRKLCNGQTIYVFEYHEATL